MKSLIRFIQHKPSAETAWATGIGLVAVWALVRLVYLEEILFPLTYVLPLMICIWTRRKSLLWAMAFVFSTMAAVEFFLIMPSEALPGNRVIYAFVSTMINILAGAVTVHLVIHLLDNLEQALNELSATNQQIREQNDEIKRHRNHLDELVEERTVELEERNRQLEDEILERKRAQDAEKNLETQLIQTQKLEALGRFAGGIAHDLNNILFPIVINIEMLIEETDEEAPSYPVLNQTLQAAYRQRDLIRQILTFSRRREKHLEPMRVKPLIEETLSLPSSIEIRRHLDAPHDSVLGDPTQVQQVIMNLCKNAAGAIGPMPGTIEVSLENTAVRPSDIPNGSKAGEYLRLSVKDTGCGMPPDVADHIFEPFFTTKDVDKGSGMGLSVVHGIIKDYGGTITVESEPGKGSLFAVYLPLAGEETDKESTASETAGLCGRRRK